MAKTEIEQKFDYMVSKVIWPRFKALGYKKSGNNFLYYNDEGWGKIVNFQKSSFYDKSHIHFTVNIGLHLEEYYMQLNKKPSGGRFAEYNCLKRRRIGELIGSNDIWFDVEESTDIEKLSGDLKGLFLEHVIPYLAQYKSKADILKILLDNPNGLFQIKTLFNMGYHKLVMSALDNAIEAFSASGNERSRQAYIKAKEDFQKSKI